MLETKIESPRQLVDLLIDILPDFAKEWDDGESYGYNGNYTYHVVFMEFAPRSHQLLTHATPAQVKRFAELLNYSVCAGGDLENAVFTCFLEHASQVGVRKILKPLLSKEAKDQLS